MVEPTRRQLQALSFIILMSPATRLIPGASARAAGHAGWLCPIVAAPLCVLVVLTVSRALKNKAVGEGLGEVVMRAFPRFGRAVLLLYGLWLSLYAGFSLRSGASRFIYTIYTGSSPWPFVAVGLAAGVLAALGSVKRLARSAEIFRHSAPSGHSAHTRFRPGAAGLERASARIRTGHTGRASRRD